MSAATNNEVLVLYYLIVFSILKFITGNVMCENLY